MRDPARVRVSGPLEPYALGFAAELSRVGYSRDSAAFQLRLMAHVSGWLAGEGLAASALTPVRGAAFSAGRGAPGFPAPPSGTGLRVVAGGAGEILVRGKGNGAERLPLPADVGEAVAGYLRAGRPSTAEGRTVFVRVKAPHRALTRGGVTQVVAAAGRRAGLASLSAHRLRHTVATELLRAGAPLAGIGQLLRHRSALTRAIY